MYTIITGEKSDYFFRDIEKALSDGWKLQGGVSICFVPSVFGENAVIYAQALVK